MKELRDFIWQHRSDDPRQLALSGKKHPGLPMAQVAAQVAALQKVARKIPAWHRPGLFFPSSVALEQCSSEATARFKASLFSGQKMADLTGGLGVDSYFFSKKFASATHVEPNAELQAAVRDNFTELGVGNVIFENTTAEDFLKKTPTNSFDLLYLDPSRRDARGGRVVQLADCEPDVVALREHLLETAPRVLVKTAPMLDIQLAIRQLEQVSRVWVLESEGECREVSYLLERGVEQPDEPQISVVALAGEQVSWTFDFSFSEEKTTEAPLAAPARFLYDPGPALLKAGAFKTFARRFGLTKLHANTHLYTSEKLVDGLPGRAFRIEHVCKFDRKTVRDLLPEGRANVAARNFPESVEQVRKRLGLRDGGEWFLFAATVVGEQRVVMVCRRV